MPTPTLTVKDAWPVWLRIGLLSFGGPAAQIAVMHRELVEQRRWISEERFLHALNFCTLLPGPEAQQLATYIGWLLHGTRGGLVAGGLFVLPGALVMWGLSALWAVFHSVPLVDALFFGLKAGLLAVVLEAVVRVGKRALQTRAAVALAMSAFVALSLFAVPFPAVVGVSAVLGALGLPVRGATARASGNTQPSLIDRLLAEGALPHTTPNLRRALGLAVTWLGLWALPVVALWWWRGADDVLTREGIFFSEAAVVTFGGAYAVLAWVAHQVVSFGWLTAPQMLDGLGLAESTPGPLILVLEFAGFGAAFFHPGSLSPLLAGTLGAAVTLWVTFTPCFLWIFVLAPWVEALRSNQRLAAALAAITASVVGVIANLTLFFALHVVFAKVGVVEFGPLSLPAPEWGTVEWRALVVAALAFALVFPFNQGLGRTLVACAVLGAGLKLGFAG